MMKMKRRDVLKILPVVALVGSAPASVAPACSALLEAKKDELGTGAASPSAHTLWYDQPAKNWNEALPIGNGRLGAMVYGGVSREKISLNEQTLWSGTPREWNNPRAREVLPQVRKAVFEGRYDDADRLSLQMQGPYNESYMPMGDVNLIFPFLGGFTTYRRELDLDSAITKVRFRHGEVEYAREVFATHPGGLMVMRLSASRPSVLTFSATLSSRLKSRSEAVTTDHIVMTGKAPQHVEPQYRLQFSDAEAIQYAESDTREGMTFQVHLRALNQGGRVHTQGPELKIEGADSVLLLISAATSYNGWDKSPGLQGRDPGPLALALLQAAARKTYEELLRAHLADYQPIFRRVQLELRETEFSSRPTDERLAAGIEKDPALAALVFQYGRYMLISASRPGGQPAHIKGMWNERLRPEWSGNWTLDHDAQMFYYPVEVANLAEMHEPFLDFIEGVAENGRVTARVNYGARGWCAHHNADLWRQSGPAGDWGQGEPHWASFAMAGPWLAQHFWEHYAFAGDAEFLRNRAWPIMKGAAEFALDWLVDDGSGHLVTNPSVSPENTFVMTGSGGETAQISMAASVDMELLWELFGDCIEAAKVWMSIRYSQVSWRMRARGSTPSTLAGKETSRNGFRTGRARNPAIVICRTSTGYFRGSNFLRSLHPRWLRRPNRLCGCAMSGHSVGHWDGKRPAGPACAKETRLFAG